MILAILSIFACWAPLCVHTSLQLGRILRSFLSHTLNERRFLPSRMAWHVTERDSRTIFSDAITAESGYHTGDFQKRNITSFCLWCGLEGFSRDIWKHFTHKILNHLSDRILFPGLCPCCQPQKIEKWGGRKYSRLVHFPLSSIMPPLCALMPQKICIPPQTRTNNALKFTANRSFVLPNITFPPACFRIAFFYSNDVAFSRQKEASSSLGAICP